MDALATLTFKVTFDRISRRHNVAPLLVTVDDGPVNAVAEQIATDIYEYANPMCASSYIDAVVNRPEIADTRPLVSTDLDGSTGFITAGMHIAGNFTIALVRDLAEVV
jgi:hypothetical protein